MSVDKGERGREEKMGRDEVDENSWMTARLRPGAEMRTENHSAMERKKSILELYGVLCVM